MTVANTPNPCSTPPLNQEQPATLPRKCSMLATITSSWACIATSGRYGTGAGLAPVGKVLSSAFTTETQTVCLCHKLNRIRPSVIDFFFYKPLCELFLLLKNSIEVFTTPPPLSPLYRIFVLNRECIQIINQIQIYLLR